MPKAFTLCAAAALTLGLGVAVAPEAEAAAISCGQPYYDPDVEAVILSCDGTDSSNTPSTALGRPTSRSPTGDTKRRQTPALHPQRRGEWSVSYEIVE